MIEEGKNHDLLGPKTIELREDDIFQVVKTVNQRSSGIVLKDI